MKWTALKKTESLQVRLTEFDMLLIRKAARKSNLPLSTWARLVMLSAAEKQTGGKT